MLLIATAVEVAAAVACVASSDAVDGGGTGATDAAGDGGSGGVVARDDPCGESADGADLLSPPPPDPPPLPALPFDLPFGCTPFPLIVVTAAGGDLSAPAVSEKTCTVLDDVLDSEISVEVELNDIELMTAS